jgi:hypothetical protein
MSIEKLDQAKISKENIPYTQISTFVIQNVRDPIAGFIWVYLSSLPVDWVVRKEQIKNKFNVGDTALKLIFSYLNRSKLIEYHRERLSTGKLGKSIIHVLCGNRFNADEHYIKTTGSKIKPVAKIREKTTGSKTRRLENHTSGSGALQKKYKNKRNIKTKKSFCEKNSKKHDFSESMDKMANEKKHIEKHEEYKWAGVPEDRRPNKREGGG